MSGSSEVLTPILLRSSTPAPSEKVLLYLEGIARSGGASPVRDSMISDSGPSADGHHNIDPNDPRFAKLHAFARPQAHRLSGLSNSYNAADEPGYSEISFEQIDRDEISSNIQEGQRSDIARSVRSMPRGQDDYQEHEPGPEDEPGPKYESFGSSFGNLGPPRESFFGPPPVQQPWVANGMTNETPARAANVALPPESEWMSPRSQPRAAPWGQHMLKPTSKAAILSPKMADVNISVEPPSDPSRYSSKAPSVAPSQHTHSRRSSGSTRQGEAAPPAQIQQLPGITVSIGADGSTTISIPRGPPNNKSPTERAPTEKAPTEKALTEIADDVRPKQRSRVGSERPAASVAGSRRPNAEAEDRVSVMSPEMQARSLRSPSKAGSRAPSKAPTRANMSPVDSYRPFNDFQSFSAPPPLDLGAPHQRAQPIKAPSSRAPSQRPAASQRAPSEFGTIPNELTGDGAFAYANRTRGGSAYETGSEVSGYEGDRRTNGYTNGHQTGETSTSSFSEAGAPQRDRAMHGYQHMSNLDARAARSKALSPVPSQPNTLRTNADDPLATPTQSRPASPDELNDYETEIVQNFLSARTPRTSIAPSLLAEELKRTQYHDEDLCILLHAADSDMHHEIVRKALRKAVAARIKKLGLKNDRESIKQYRKKFHDHDPSWHITHGPSYNPDDPPAWAKEMMEQLQSMENRVAALGPQLARLKKSDDSRTRTQSHSYRAHGRPMTETQEDYERTPRTQTIPIGTQMTGTMADESMYRHPETEYTIPGESMGPTTIPGSLHHHDGSTHGPMATDRDEFEDEETQGPNGLAYTDRTPLTRGSDYLAHKRGDLFSTSGRGESPGQQVLEEELYRLRVKEQSRSVAMTHQSWVLAEESVGGEQENHEPESEIPDIDEDRSRADSPPLPPLPAESQAIVETHSQSHGANAWQAEYQDHPPTPPWQRIHQRLLNWAIVWPMTELDTALNSTLRGSQVDEVALSIWSTQMYKRYVRQQLTEVPPGRVDRLFVPPNMADAINNAVFHGRHGDACGMLRDLWTPFGLEGMPRIIVVLCKHRSDPNHWVAHKFSLPDGTLTTYDTYPEKCLPDGRPLGWWFAIRIAWPGAMYPSPDHLMQKMVRLHRPMQLDIDNSVAAAGIWRNLLMGSRAERPVDLERLRDLINTEVKNLRQRKEQGKLSVAAAVRQNWNWDDMAA